VDTYGNRFNESCLNSTTKDVIPSLSTDQPIVVASSWMSGKNRDELCSLFLDRQTFPSARICGVKPPTTIVHEKDFEVGKPDPGKTE
jgi:hypothetical protein